MGASRKYWFPPLVRMKSQVPFNPRRLLMFNSIPEKIENQCSIIRRSSSKTGAIVSFR